MSGLTFMLAEGNSSSLVSSFFSNRNDPNGHHFYKSIHLWKNKSQTNTMVFEMWHNLILKKYFNLVLWNLEGVQSYKILVTITAIMLCKGVVFSLQHFQCSSDEYLLSSAVLTDDLSAIQCNTQAWSCHDWTLHASTVDKLLVEIWNQLDVNWCTNVFLPLLNYHFN